MMFQDAVVKAAATGTLNRQTLLDALKSTHDETAHGIVGTTDIGATHAQPLHDAVAGEERQVGARVPEPAGHVQLRSPRTCRSSSYSA